MCVWPWISWYLCTQARRDGISWNPATFQWVRRQENATRFFLSTTGLASSGIDRASCAPPQPCWNIDKPNHRQILCRVAQPWGFWRPSVLEGKRQKGQQEDLYAPHEHRQRQPSGRQISVNQLNFIPEYKEYLELGSLRTNPNFN